MDNKLGILNFTSAEERIAEKAEKQQWEEDTEVVEMGMSELSDIANGFNMIRKGMEMISNATGVDLGSV